MPGLACRIVAVGLAMLLATAAAALAEGPRGPLMRIQEWAIPSPAAGRTLIAHVFSPVGDEPRPLALLTHGTGSSANSRNQSVPTYLETVSWFFERGYTAAVLQRSGYGKTGGPRLDQLTECSLEALLALGRVTAGQIEDALRFLRRQPFVDARRVIVVGQSSGGWGALSLAAKSPELATGYVNFAGGRGGRFKNLDNVLCNRKGLVTAAGRLGATVRAPTLWLYTENDKFFDPSVAGDMFAAFRAAGGTGSLAQLPRFPPHTNFTGDDGHMLMWHYAGPAVWGPHVERFLADLAAR